MPKISLAGFRKSIAVAIIAVMGVVAAPKAFADSPMLNVTQDGSANVRLTVSNAQPYASITLNSRQGSTQLWTIVSNFGVTDQNGYFSSSIGIGNSWDSSPIEYYVTVNGQQSTTQIVYPGTNNNCNYNCGNCNYNNCGNYGQITFSQNNITLNYNQSSTVTVYGGYNNNYYISNNSNSNSVTASLSGSQLSLYAKNSGNTQITVCSNNTSQCGILYATVSYGGNNNNNTITFGEVSPVVSIGQTRAIAINGGYNNYYSNNYYISSTTNNNVISATISGSSLSLYGINNGSSTVTVCQSGNGCGSLYVSVVGYNNGNNYNNGNYNAPNLTTTTLPAAYSGQYYTYQLQATGGSYPYTYAIASGNMPSGLALSYNGAISGLPQCGGSRDFTVQVTDNAGRNSTRQLNIPMTNCGYGYGNGYGSGYVYGTSTYKNGSLIKENGTVYLVYKNTKTGFANAGAFLGLGFSWANVQTTGYTGLAQSAYTVSSSYSRHPWGTWIKAGNTVYFVHELGLIPVPSYEVFLNNGGEDRLVVPANSYDFSGNILNPLDYSDSRLR